jgi:uncharacterized protein (DUF849 family)
MALVRELHPEAVSVALRELLPADAPQDEALAFLTWLAGSGIMAQVILYDVEDLRRWQALRARGDIPEAPWFLLFVLGRYSAGQRSQPADLLPFVQAHTGPEPWAVCAFGAQENACLLTAAALAAMRAWVSRTTCCCPTAAPRPTTPPWCGWPPRVHR